MFGNIKVAARNGEDFTRFCTSRTLAPDDYVPGMSYSLTNMNKDRPMVYVKRFDNDGSYFEATAPDKPTLISLNCRKTLSNSFSEETVYRVHINIGEFISPKLNAASYFGHLYVHLENGGKVTTSLNEGDDTTKESTPLRITRLRLPLSKIPLESIGEPVGWSATTSTAGHILFP